MAVSIKVEGSAELMRQLDRLEKTVRDDVMDKALLEAAEPVRAEAERLTPRSNTPGGTSGQGHAQDHIVAQIKKKGKEAEVGPLSAFWYLIFAEFGTPWSPAKAMFRRAADSEFGKAAKAFQRVVQREIAKVAR